MKRPTMRRCPFHRALRGTRRWFLKLRLTDRFLLLFMLLLLGQAAHNLFFHELSGATNATLDVAFRTTTASIFGYFIGVGFLRNHRPSPPANEAAPLQPPVAGASPLEELPLSPPPSPPTLRFVNQQVIIVALIGIVSLILLIIAHNDGRPTAAAAGTISQLRDFVSGSVGLLIGHSAQKDDD